MTTDPREHLLHWLRDAYAMEKQALEMCEKQAGRIENYPAMRDRIARHTEETKDQLAQLDRCFDILGESPSSVKDAMGWLTGNMQAVGGVFAEDEIVKGSLASYTFENMEIASYSILIAAAEAANEPEIARICSNIREQEKDMAGWLMDHIPETTQAFMQRDAADTAAKR